MPREFRTVLCPIDFSDASYHAADYALRFAKGANGTLLLVHSLHNPAGEFFHGPDGHTLAWGEVQTRAETTLAAAHRERLGNYDKTERIVDVGDPHEIIVGIARQRGADLIVVSTHGRTGLSHLLLGSVAEKIIRHAPCPVFVVPRNID